MVRVVSCRFMRLSCSEDDHPLFRRYYARSNRERGVKLLRCFPHCCPEHVQRCYCGTSIHVQVTFATELPPAAHGNLIICARFEPSRVVPLWPTNLIDTSGYEGDQDHERKIQPGEVVSLPESVMYPKSRQPKQTVWITADREGESKQTTKNATLYVLNNHRFPKWLYSYDSSVTRTQREMTHHLVVYVFQLTGSRSQPGEIDATVLARHESPGFTLISYRRSGNNSRDAGCDLPAVEISSNNNFAAVDVDTPQVSPSDDMEIDSYGPTTGLQRDMDTKYCGSRQTQHQNNQHQEQWQPPAMQKPEEQWRLRYPSHIPTFKYKSLDAATREIRNDIRFDQGNQSQVEADEFLWQKEAEASEPGFREKTQQMLILWRFLQHVTFSDLNLSPDTIETQIHSHWLRAAAALRAPDNSNAQLEVVVASFLSSIFEINSARATHSPRLSYTGTNSYTARDQATTKASVFLFLQALSSRSIQQLFRESYQLGNGETNTELLRKRFVSLVLDIYNILDSVLRKISTRSAADYQNLSLPALVDNILSLIYGRSYFSVLRDEVSSILLDRQTPNALSDTLNETLRIFTAQTQESRFAMMAQHLQATQQHWDAFHNAWSHRWFLDPGSVNFTAVEHGTKQGAWHGASLVGVAQLVREFGCVDITVAGSESVCMSVGTALSFDSITAMAPMELTLDGRMRGFRILPSGTSSAIPTAGGWSIGDYKASFSDDSHCLNIHFYAFVETSTISVTDRPQDLETMVRQVSLSVTLEQELKEANSQQPRDRFIIVQGTVYGSTFSHANGIRGRKLKMSAMSNGNRGVDWNELKWTPLFEVQAGYVAL